MPLSGIQVTPMKTAFLLTLPLLALFARAQDPVSVLGQVPDPWLAPLHTSADTARAGAYGTWASGADFKASFHDGPVFYPLLGKAWPHNLPVRLHTSSVRVGTHELMADGDVPGHTHGEWRYEYRHRAFVEAYDVLPRGVEQTFTFASRPEGEGDLVITIAVESELVAKPRVEAHGAFEFTTHDGTPLVAYGAAFAIDATGARTEVATGYATSTITLRVPATVLANARFPLTVDPLLGRTVLDGSGTTTTGGPTATRIASDPSGNSQGLLLAYARNFSAGDEDVYARSMNHDFGNQHLVFSEVNAAISTLPGGVAYAGGAGRWAIALERTYPAANRSWTDLYFHTLGNTTVNSGIAWLNPSTGTGITLRHPDVGGSVNGTRVLIAYDSDATSTQADTANTRVSGWIVDATTGTGLSNFELDTNLGSDDCERPSVTQVTNGSAAPWVVCYQRFDNSLNPPVYEIWGIRVAVNGATSASARLSGGLSAAYHHMQPRVAGNVGHFLATCVDQTSVSTSFGVALRAIRFDWSDAATAPTVLASQDVDVQISAKDIFNGDLAFDTVTDSHWGAVWQRGGFSNGDIFAARLGGNAGICEASTVYAQPSTGGYVGTIAFATNGFKLAHCTIEAPNQPIYGYDLVYDPQAVNASYGTACGGTAFAGIPYAGNSYYDLGVFGAAASRPASLLLGTAAAALPLDSVGMPSCTLLVGNAFGSFPFTTDGTGRGSLRLPIPEVVAFDLYLQVFVADPAAPWATKVTASQGVLSRIRR